MAHRRTLSRNKNLVRVAISSAAGELELLVGVAGKSACLYGFFIVPEGDGTFCFKSDDTVGGAGTEVALTGVMKMVDAVAVGYRADVEAPIAVAGDGLSLTIELGTSGARGWAIVGYDQV